ncbi:hypothetical protein BX600DRAFT_430121 [Xylariales sp. PMI_506]|nr:hypothetical protein BX600DRAFT_430121 [Xylariales sp. PMI_506]
MAKAPRDHQELSSSPLVPSQSDLLSDVRLSARLFRIEKRQKALLDSSESWAHILQRGPLPGVNLPPEVLENLRAFHRRRQIDTENTSSRKSPTVKESSVGNPTVASSNRSSPPAMPPQELVQVGLGEEDDNGGDDVDALSNISWAPSPEAHLHPKMMQERFLSQSPEPMHCEDSPECFSEKVLFQSQLPARSPLQPTMDVSNIQRKPAFTDFPSSSLDVEEELEIVVPMTYNKPAPTVNNTARELDPAPPSAQIQVPCTFEPNSSVPGADPRKKDGRKINGLASVSQVLQRVGMAQPGPMPQSMPLARGRMALPPTKTLPVGFSDSQSTADSSPSIIPATIETSRQSPVQMRRVLKSTIKETPEATRPALKPTHEDNKTADDTPQRQPPAYSPAPSQLRGYSPASTHSPEARQPSRQPESPQPASDCILQQPFIRYSLCYPNYTGSVGDFVKACIIIQALQRKRALASYQYDDFIRAWSEGYLPYIENLDESEHPLTAIEWYMEFVEEPVFLAKVVTSKNLASVLAFHADEVHSARRSLGISRNREPSPAVIIPEPSTPGRPSNPAKPAAATDEATSPVGQGIENHLPPPASYSAQVDRHPPKPAPSLDRQTVGGSPISAIMLSQMEIMEPVSPVPSTPSITEKSTRKRPLRDDSPNLPASKRRTPSQESPAPPVTDRLIHGHDSLAAPPRSTGPYLGRRRTDETQEQRSKRFKKFLQKRKSRGGFDNISVTSSAPPNTAPTPPPR